MIEMVNKISRDVKGQVTGWIPTRTTLLILTAIIFTTVILMLLYGGEGSPDVRC